MATKTRKTGTPRRTAIEAAPPAIETARAEVQQAIEAAAEAPTTTTDFMAEAADTAQDAVVEAAEPVVEAVEPMTEAAVEAVETVADTTQTAADTAVSTTETVVNSVQEDVKTMASKFETTATETANQFADKAQGAVQKSQQYAADFADMGKGNIEAMVESTRIAAKGAEDIFKYSTDYGRQTIEKANETAKRFASVKSPVEFFQLQTEISKSFVEAIVAEGSKFTENYLKLVSETVQPLSNRFAVAADKVKAAA